MTVVPDSEYAAFKKWQERQAAIAEKQKHLVSQVQQKRKEQANPVGPRQDEINGQVPEERHGDSNPCATGPAPVAWTAPQRGKWVQGPDKAEHFIPDESWQPRTTTEQREPSVPVAPAPKIAEPWLEKGSGIGARPVSRFAASPCGPAPVEWVDPNPVKPNPMIKFVPKKS